MNVITLEACEDAVDELVGGEEETYNLDFDTDPNKQKLIRFGTSDDHKFDLIDSSNNVLGVFDTPEELRVLLTQDQNFN